MTTTTERATDLDVLIIGAGLSGVGVAWHLQQTHPERTVALLEARQALGGTWDLFRYPGIRSDSDLATFAYRFRPWLGEKALADGPDILNYIRQTAADAGIDQRIRYGHKVLGASWCSADARWTVDIEVDGQRSQLTCRWLFSAAGYYRYDKGFTPRIEGLDRFQGQVVHPQHWPEDLDYAGKKVVVIGSGATAVTLVPALAATAGHVTMLQRSPSYVMPVPGRDPIAALLRRRFGEQRGHELTRRKNIWMQRTTYNLCQRRPELAKKLIRTIQSRFLPQELIDQHFTPSYGPWDQRLCAVPDGDLFAALREGRAEVVTDRIATVDETGIQLVSGQHLDADLIITATGLNLLTFGGIALQVDGRSVHWPDTLAYKGMMLSGVPNYGYAIGYTNSSWTLKVDLVAEHLCRLLSAMDAQGAQAVVPVAPEGEPTRPLLDFAAGYVLRSVDTLPRQGARLPWKLNMSYKEDVAMLLGGQVLDPALRLFSAEPTLEAAA